MQSNLAMELTEKARRKTDQAFPVHDPSFGLESNEWGGTGVLPLLHLSWS
uniref:Uncharacterized protein n=1 Tax=Nelumbo nucifera TaxID=4432 RepID=A0A822Z2K4_NELNU|nr:TPA_asm: hypothetical protein HUJ06_013585 [Nelumbo nucifera]